MAEAEALRGEMTQSRLRTDRLSPRFKAKLDFEVVLPMSGHQGSLNLNVLRWWISLSVLVSFMFSHVFQSQCFQHSVARQTASVEILFYH